MKNNKRKWLYQLGIPIIMIYLLIICVALTSFNQNGLIASSVLNQPLIILANLGVALCLNLGSLVILSSKYTDRSTKIAHILEHLLDEAVNTELSVIENDPDELSQAVLALASKMQTYSDAANQLAAGQLSLETLPVANNDVLGKSLCSIGESLSRLEEGTKKLTTMMEPDDVKLVAAVFQESICLCLKILTEQSFKIRIKSHYMSMLWMPYRIPCIFLIPIPIGFFLIKLWRIHFCRPALLRTGKLPMAEKPVNLGWNIVIPQNVRKTAVFTV